MSALKMMENNMKNLTILRSKIGQILEQNSLEECDAELPEEEKAYKQEMKENLARNSARIESGIVEAQQIVELISIIGQLDEKQQRIDQLEWENAQLREQNENVGRKMDELMDKMGEKSDFEGEEEEETNNDENRPPSSLAALSEVEGTAPSDLEDLFFDTEDEENDLQSEFDAPANSVISNAVSAEQKAKIEFNAIIQFCNKLFNDSNSAAGSNMSSSISAYICEKGICEMKAKLNEGNGQMHRNWAIFHKRLVQIYKKKGDYRRVFDYLEGMSKYYEQKGDIRSKALIMCKQGVCLKKLGKWMEAEKMCRKGLEQLNGSDNLEATRKLKFFLEEICKNPKYLESLRKMKTKCQEELEIRKAKFGPEHQKVKSMHEKLEEIEEKIGEMKKKRKEEKERKEVGTSGI